LIYRVDSDSVVKRLAFEQEIQAAISIPISFYTITPWVKDILIVDVKESLVNIGLYYEFAQALFINVNPGSAKNGNPIYRGLATETWVLAKYNVFKPLMLNDDITGSIYLETNLPFPCRRRMTPVQVRLRMS
jgi:hypothetical protein